ncbi:MAG: PAS domain S-box protein [Methylophilaceae bacterium]
MQLKKSTFSIRLKALLAQKQLTLAEVAGAIGTSAPSVHRWTRGGEIEYENLRALAKFLEVNWIWLRYGDEAIDELKESVPSNTFATEERRKYLGQIMENEALMTLAQDMARIAIWEWNVLTNELTASANSERIFGQQIETVRASMLPFETFDLEALTAKFTNSELPPEWDFKISIDDSKSVRWFAARGKMVFDAQGRPFKIVGVSIDITERKQLESSLELSEYMMRKVIETIPLGLWVADQSGRITTANPEAERIWGGAKLVELSRYSEYKGWREDTGQEVSGADWTLARAVKHGEVSLGEVVNIEAFDGERRTIIMSAIPLLDANQKIIGAIEVNQDITALKRVEDSLKLTVEQWDATFEQPLIGIAYCKANGGLHINAKFAELIGSNVQELTSDDLESYLDEDARRTFKSKIQNKQPDKTTTFMLPSQLKCKGGTPKSILLGVTCYAATNAIFKYLIFAIEATSATLV